MINMISKIDSSKGVYNKNINNQFHLIKINNWNVNSYCILVW